MQDYIYLYLEDKIQKKDPLIYIEDIGQVTGPNESIVKQIRKLLIYELMENKREVVTSFFVITKIQKAFPDVMIVPIGATEIIMECSSKTSTNKWLKWWKVLFVSSISFFGTAFTIMAFHNDIGILSVFEQITNMIIGKSELGIAILEISYSIGLAVGIIVFFNRFGKKKITKDPTPIEVSMSNYEEDVNKTLAKVWERGGKAHDAP